MKANAVRTNVVLDNTLVKKAMKATGQKTKRAAIEEALRTVVRLHDQRAILDLAGKVRWTGDLRESRKSRLR